MEEGIGRLGQGKGNLRGLLCGQWASESGWRRLTNPGSGDVGKVEHMEGNLGVGRGLGYRKLQRSMLISSGWRRPKWKMRCWSSALHLSSPWP